MTRRLGPLLLLALAAPLLWVWNGGLGLFPVERELVWQLPSSGGRPVREVEVQLWHDDALLKRESRRFPPGEPVPSALVQKLPLREGHYSARIFLIREGDVRPVVLTRGVTVGREALWVTQL